MNAGTPLLKYYDVCGLIDMYNLYSPTCPLDTPFSNSISSSSSFSSPTIINYCTLNALKFNSGLEILRRMPGGGGGYDPCTKNYATTYFNRPDVQEALHANVTKIAYPSIFCRRVEHWVRWVDFLDRERRRPPSATFAPKRSLQIIRHFLANKKLPSVAF